RRKRPRMPRRPVVAPCEGGVGDRAFRNEWGAVPLVEGQIAVLVADRIAVNRVVPRDAPHQPPGVGIDQKLVRVVAMTLLRLVGAVDAQPVKLPWAQVGKIAVPYLVGIFRKGDALYLALAIPVEQANL